MTVPALIARLPGPVVALRDARTASDLDACAHVGGEPATHGLAELLDVGPRYLAGDPFNEVSSDAVSSDSDLDSVDSAPRAAKRARLWPAREAPTRT